MPTRLRLHCRSLGYLSLELRLGTGVTFARPNDDARRQLDSVDGKYGEDARRHGFDRSIRQIATSIS
jgi:hypothetical protein